MAKKIERLTTEQASRIPEIRDAWFKIGFSTERADRKRAEAGVIAAYGAAGMVPPKLFIWLNSPMAGAIGAVMLSKVGAQVGAQVWDQVWDQVRAQVWDQVGDQVGDQVWDQVWAQVRAQVGDQVGAQVGAQVRDQVWDQVWAQVRAQVGDQVRDQVRAQVWDQVGDQVRDQVRAQVWDQVGDQVRAQVGDQVGAQVYKAVWGQHDAWLSFYAFFHTAVGLESVARLKGQFEVAASSGWWWPFEGAVILTERPVSLSRDNSGRLHSGDGAAIKYPDGWGIYAVHGVRLPTDLAEDHGKITVARIDAERNAEVRRVLIGWYGMDRYMRDSGARIVHQDLDQLGNERRLLWRDQPSDEPIVLIEVTDSTPQPDGTKKKYPIRVDPKAYGGRAGKECHAAIASTWREKGDATKMFFKTPEAYRPLIET